MGSSGGSGTTVGGSGGGAVRLNADYISVSSTGRIHMDGGAAVSTASTSRGGGGGAGGGIMLTAGHVVLGGVFSANGSDGAAGTSTANDSGGGGGGGRVKVLYSGTTSGTVTMTAAFGVGGPYGTQAPGQPGTVGTTSNVTGGGYDVPPVVYGSESALAVPVLTLSATSICSSDSINATATAGFSSYLFMVNGNPVFTGTTNSYTFTGLSNGDILSVAGINSPCFASESEPDTISVSANSSAGTVMSSAGICQGGDDTLTTLGSVGVISWYEFDGTNYNFVGGGDPLILGPMNTTGTFSFVAVANNGGCAIDTSAFTTTVVSAAPVAGTVSTNLADTNLCAFDSIVFTANGSNGTLAWYIQFMQTGPYQYFGSGNSFNPGPPSNSDVGSHNFIVVASASGCPDDTSASTPVSVRETPVVALGNDTILCGSSLLLDAGNPGYSYLWNTNDTTQTVLATTSMAYDVAITTPYGCVGRDTVNVTINQQPVVDLGADTSTCGSITLDAGNAGASYLWSNGPSTQTNLITASGLYYVDVTSGPGCTDSDTINVVVNTLPVVTLSVSTSTVCIDDANVVLTGGSPSGGTYAGPGVSGNQFDPTTAGNGTHTITYTYTDTNGCSAQATAQITVNACVGIADNSLLESVVVYPNPNNGSFNLTVNGGEPGDMIIEVTDITGRVVYTHQENNVGAGFVTTVDLGDVAEGSYFLRITSGNETRTEKLIIE